MWPSSQKVCPPLLYRKLTTLKLLHIRNCVRGFVPGYTHTRTHKKYLDSQHVSLHCLLYVFFIRNNACVYGMSVLCEHPWLNWTKPSSLLNSTIIRNGSFFLWLDLFNKIKATQVIQEAVHDMTRSFLYSWWSGNACSGYWNHEKCFGSFLICWL